MCVLCEREEKREEISAGVFFCLFVFFFRRLDCVLRVDERRERGVKEEREERKKNK